MQKIAQPFVVIDDQDFAFVHVYFSRLDFRAASFSIVLITNWLDWPEKTCVQLPTELLSKAPWFNVHRSVFMDASCHCTERLSRSAKW
jgi:hypothetical protein